MYSFIECIAGALFVLGCVVVTLVVIGVRAL